MVLKVCLIITAKICWFFPSSQIKSINSETLFSFFRDEREREIIFLSSSEKLTKIWFVVVVVVVGHKRETKMKIVKDHKR